MGDALDLVEVRTHRADLRRMRMRCVLSVGRCALQCGPLHLGKFLRVEVLAATVHMRLDAGGGEPWRRCRKGEPGPGADVGKDALTLPLGS